MEYQTNKLKEDERKIKLDNEEMSVSDFNRRLEGLKPGQRILESSDDNFHIVERLKG